MANVKRVYLCKSDRTSSATLRIVRDALSKYECEVVEHERGDTYDHEAKDNLLEADFLLVCPPKVGEYVVTPREYRRYDRIGKGQIEQINDFSWEKGTKDQIYMILDREDEGLYLGRVTSTHVTDSGNWIEHGEVYTSPVHHDHMHEIFSLQNISLKGARVNKALTMNARFRMDGTSREGYAFAKGQLCSILGRSKMNSLYYRIIPNKIMLDPKTFYVVHETFIEHLTDKEIKLFNNYTDPMMSFQRDLEKREWDELKEYMKNNPIEKLDIYDTRDSQWTKMTQHVPIVKPMLALYKKLKQ